MLLALRGTAGLLRWLAWKGMKIFDPNVSTDSIWAGPRHLLERLYYAEISIQRAADLVALPVAIFAAWAFSGGTSRSAALGRSSKLPRQEVRWNDCRSQAWLCRTRAAAWLKSTDAGPLGS